MGFDGSQRRWVSDHLVAVVECGCGLFVAALGIVLGAQATTALVRAVPYLIAAVGLALVVTGVRRSRAAERRVVRDAPARDAATPEAAAPDVASWPGSSPCSPPRACSPRGHPTRATSPKQRPTTVRR